MESLVKIRLYNPEKDWKELTENAKADNHAGVYCPTHVSYIEKDGKETIVGYLSIGVVPMILTWQSTKHVGPIDSMRLLGFVEGVTQQYKYICFPCDPESPYNRLLPKAGYVEYTKPVKLYVKEAK